MDITVIVPVKNRREHIGRTLDSIMKSGMQPTEVIIVDNESTDGTYQFCEQYIKNRSNITLLRETFPGAAAARNKGLKSCKTEWVYFFDSDDLFDYNYISTMHRLDAEDYDVIASPCNMVVNGKQSVRTFIPDGDPCVQILANVLSTQSMLFKTRFLKDIGAWNIQCRIWNDWELGLRVLLHRPKILWYTERAFHTINVHPESITGYNFSQSYKQLVSTLTVAINDLHSSILQPLSRHHAQNLACLYPNLERLIFPLYLRTCVLIGHMQNERILRKNNKEKMAVRSLRVFLHDFFQPTLAQRILGNVIRLYTAVGGRGAWRIALAICKNVKFPQNVRRGAGF